MNGSLLQNGDGRWTSSHHWTLPSINATGVIRNTDTGMVLGIVDRDSGEYEPNNMEKEHYLSFVIKGYGNWMEPSYPIRLG